MDVNGLMNGCKWMDVIDGCGSINGYMWMDMN